MVDYIHWGNGSSVMLYDSCVIVTSAHPDTFYDFTGCESNCPTGFSLVGTHTPGADASLLLVCLED
jgi:acetoin utilization deacetylase AcuC-like enzyme